MLVAISATFSVNERRMPSRNHPCVPFAAGDNPAPHNTWIGINRGRRVQNLLDSLSSKSQNDVRLGFPYLLFQTGEAAVHFLLGRRAVIWWTTLEYIGKQAIPIHVDSKFSQAFFQVLSSFAAQRSTFLVLSCTRSLGYNEYPLLELPEWFHLGGLALAIKPTAVAAIDGLVAALELDYLRFIKKE